MLIFMALSLTYAKGALLSVFIFFLTSILLLKGKRIFMISSCLLFIIVIIVNTVSKNIIIFNKKAPVPEIVFTEPGTNLVDRGWWLRKIHIPKKVVTVSTVFKERAHFERLNIFGAVGMYSVNSRLKAIEVSLQNSFLNMRLTLFGNGAGTSQRLLPGMANNYDKYFELNKGAKYSKMLHEGTIGEAANNNISLIDAHNLFITELFNIGIIGSSSLLLMVCLILYKQFRVISKNYNKYNIMNELLFATLLAMLAHRMTASFVAIPFLWFILGLSIGVSKLKLLTEK